MFNKKNVAMSLIFLMVLSVPLFSGCSSKDGKDLKIKSGSTKTTTIKIANYYAVEHPVNIKLKDVFKKNVEEKTNGSIKIEIYPNNQLGDEQEYIEGVQTGSIQMAMSGNLWENTVPEFRVMQMPYMFMNYDHADEVLNGPIGESIYKYLEPLNVKVLASFPNGFREISNNIRPINTIEDTKGINLRVFEGETIIKLMKNLGFKTTVMSMAEVFTSLQQGVVDGQDNPLSNSYYSGYYEAQKFVAITNHMYSPGYVVINNDVWKGLTTEEQTILKEAAQETADQIKISVKELDQEITESIKKQGIVVTYPELQPFIEKSAPIIEEYIDKYPQLKDPIKQIQESGKKYLNK